MSFTFIIVTHVSIRTSDTSSKAYASPSLAYRTLRYPITKSNCQSFGKWFEPRYIFGAGSLN
jgi:hypothetical protein